MAQSVSRHAYARTALSGFRNAGSLLAGFVRGGLGSTFTLASLYAAEDDGFVFDDLTAYAFVDTGGTTPWSVSGDPLGYLVDQRGAYDAVAPTSAARSRLIVDEAGTFIRHDNLDDALTVSGLPDLGTSCTIGYVTRSEVRLLEGQTVNGTYTLPNDGDLAGLFVINRALTLEEKVLAIRHLASKVEGVNYGAEIDRLALICVNAVDVFVYDTSLDSDGGAWRTGAAALASSWYNETLNTANRGARREFPEVAIIVVEDNYVYIYDADTPDLPMWMRFTVSFGTFINQVASSARSAFALNGDLFIPCWPSVAWVRFVSDNLWWLRSGAPLVASGVANRDAGSPVTQDPLTWDYRLSSQSANRQVRAYIPDGSPSDPETGLPSPVIAIACSDKVNVLNGILDGTERYSATITPGRVRISSDGELVALSSDGTAHIWTDPLQVAANSGVADSTITFALGTPTVLEVA